MASSSAMPPSTSSCLSSSSTGESVIVVVDADRSRINTHSLTWALHNVVRPKDTLIVLGVVCEFGRKASCFSFFPAIGGIFAIWEKLDFSAPPDMSSRLLEEDIVAKQEEFQTTLQQFHRQCKRNEVKLELKLAAGYSPKSITVEEGRSTNARWIVLESHFKKDRIYIYDNVGCNVAVMKRNNVLATIIPYMTLETRKQETETTKANGPSSFSGPNSHQNGDNFCALENGTRKTRPNPCWTPLSFQPGYPRSFTVEELESITSSFSEENVSLGDENLQVYHGTVTDYPIIIKCYSDDDERFYSELDILARVRHRNILSLVGYCCTDDALCLLTDDPCYDSLEAHLHRDETAKRLSWKTRHSIALQVGNCLRYLQEECLGGPIVHLSLCSSCVLVTNAGSPLLTDFCSAKWLKRDHERSTTSSSIREEENSMEAKLMSFDVRAYGLLLIELITARGAVGENAWEDNYIAEKVIPLLENGSLGMIIDSRLTGTTDVEEVLYMAAAALLCLHSDMDRRPSMSEVVSVLQGERHVATARW